MKVVHRSIEIFQPEGEYFTARTSGLWSLLKVVSIKTYRRTLYIEGIDNNNKKMVQTIKLTYVQKGGPKKFENCLD